MKQTCFLTYRHGVKSCYDLRTGQSLQAVFQCLEVDTLLRIIRRVHQHGQAILHTRQLGRNHCKVLSKQNVFKNNSVLSLVHSRQVTI